MLDAIPANFIPGRAITGVAKKLEYRCGVIYAGCPSFFCFGIRGRAYSTLELQRVIARPGTGG